MCRLLAYAAPRATSVANVLGPTQCELFELLSMLHDDGWGSIWVPAAARDVERHRASGAGHTDTDLSQILTDERASARVVHLRLATRSMEIDVRNSHPFLAGGVGFAHNGAIVPTDALRGMLGARDLAQVEGTTDSELYFALVRRGLRWGMTAVEAVRAAVHRIRGSYPFPSLNAMLLTPTELIVVHSSAHAQVPYHDFGGLADLPIGHDEDYYRLAYQRRTDGTVVVSSTGLRTDDWTPLPQNSLTRVDLDTLEMSVEGLNSQRIANVA